MYHSMLEVGGIKIRVSGAKRDTQMKNGGGLLHTTIYKTERFYWFPQSVFGFDFNENTK